MRQADAFTNRLREALGEAAVVSETDTLARYCRDWSGDLRPGTASPIATPRVRW